MKLRIALVAVTAVSLVLGVSGCNLIQAQATKTQYEASDGVNVTLTKVALRNLVIISDDGELGNLLFGGVNTSGTDVDVKIRYDQDGALTEQVVTVVSAEQPTEFGGVGQPQVILSQMGVNAGSMVTMFFSANGETIETLVPVLNTSQIQYKDLAPMPIVTATPTATPAG